MGSEEERRGLIKDILLPFSRAAPVSSANQRMIEPFFQLPGVFALRILASEFPDGKLLIIFIVELRDGILISELASSARRSRVLPISSST